jgi:hypothetical protein
VYDGGRLIDREVLLAGQQPAALQPQQQHVGRHGPASQPNLDEDVQYGNDQPWEAHDPELSLYANPRSALVVSVDTSDSCRATLVVGTPKNGEMVAPFNFTTLHQVRPLDGSSALLSSCTCNGMAKIAGVLPATWLHNQGKQQSYV